jgi:tRNA pseudouridine38-40 synthase
MSNTDIEQQDKKITLIFKAQSFLYQQIRIMVGSLVEVGLKNKNPSWIRELLNQKDRTLAGPTMPSKGLILNSIEY